MKKEIYLVTGAAGFLGNNLVRTLLEQKKNVRVFIRSNKFMPKYDAKFETFIGDVRDKTSIRPFFEGLEKYSVYVIHCAGIVSIASKYDQMVYDVNVNGTKNIVDLCLEYNVSKLVYISSVHAIPEGKKGSTIKEINEFKEEEVIGLYAKTKSVATAYVLDAAQKGLNASVIHPSGIIGPNDPKSSHLTQMIVDYMNRSLTAIVPGGYDFVDVRDVVDGIISCVKKGRQGECYICSNRFFTVKEIMDTLHLVTGRKPIKTILPLWLAKLTAPLAELYYKLRKQAPLYTKYSLYTLSGNSLFTHEKATKELGYHPRDMKETLKDTALWLEESGRLKK